MTTLDEKALEACPFCGGTNVHAIERTCDQNTPYNPADYAYPRVQCRCGAEIAGKNWSGKETAIAAWNRRAALPQPDTPSDWVLVPREPTREMFGAWYRYKHGWHSVDEPAPSDTSDVGAYTAMLAASPTPVSGEPVAEPFLTGVGWENLSCDDQLTLATQIAANVGYVLSPAPEPEPIPLYAHPPKATVTDDGWQPIESAPKDGTEVLLWLGNPWSRVEKARWYASWGNWQVGNIPADPAREEAHGIGSALPTHWRPLPAPPLTAAMEVK